MTPDQLLARIDGCGKPAVLLRGPAACGKTSAVLALYRRSLAEDGRPRCLLLAPGGAATRRLRRELLAAAPSGVILSPRVLTFADLAAELLAGMGDMGRILPPFHRHLLLRHIVDEAIAEGKLRVFAPVADTPGLIAALDRSIAELKRAAAEPDDLAAATGTAEGKVADLLEVYRRYQQHLVAGGAYDTEGRMWQLRERLASLRPEQPLPGLDSLAAVAVDGFTDFTPTQLSILALLGRRLQRLVITLPYESDGRPRMWHWTDRTLRQVRKAFGNDLAEVELSAPVAEEETAPNGISLRGLSQRLFDLEKVGDAVAALNVEAEHSPLKIISAAGVEAEVSAVARRVKRLLLEGQAGSGIAVLARSTEEYRPVVERLFRRCNIPIAPAAQALTDAPIVRFLFQVAGLWPRLAFQNVLHVIKSSYFRPRALGPFDGATVAVGEMVIREGNVLEGRESYARAAAWLVRRPAEVDDDGEPLPLELGKLRATPQQIAAAAEMLDRLFGLAQAASQPCPADSQPATGNQLPAAREDAAAAQTPAAAAATGLLGLMDALQLTAAAYGLTDPDLMGRDLRALSALRTALQGLPQPPPSLDEIRQALAAVTCPAAKGESLVDVLDVLDARAMRYDHVFILGVGENHFPRRFAESSLLGEGDRMAWAGRGIPLDSRGDLTAREMLLFYLAVTRAGKSLTLSYQQSDSLGRAAAPSYFLTSLLEGVGGLEAAGKLGLVEQIPAGQFVPAAGDVASPGEALMSAVAGLFTPEADSAGAMAWAKANARASLGRCAAGIWARHRRWSAAPCDAFDGRISDPALLASLHRRFPGQTVFSASQFDAFGQCPWRFFAQYVLKLQPLDEPQRRLEATNRGIFCHNVLQGVMRELCEGAAEGVALAGVPRERLVEALDKSFAAQCARVEASQVPYPALWNIQRQQMRQDLLDYLLSQQSGELASRSLHFEYGFGMAGRNAEFLDPASAPEPFSLAGPGGPIRVRGKIDRIDRVQAPGGEGLFIVDYKTGRLPSLRDIQAGRNVQLPLYSAAVEAILGRPSSGGAFHRIGGDDKRIQCFATFKFYRGQIRPDETFARHRQAVLETIGRFVQAMSEGRFDLCPTQRCPSYCPFRQICHFSPVRQELKQPAATEAAP